VTMACTMPEEVLSTVTVPLICTNPLETLTTGMLKPGALLHGLVAAVAVTVGTDDRLNTVESVTGIVPPDEATITNGALLRVTVPLDSEGMLLSTTVQLLLGETMPDEIAMAEDSVTVPLESDVALLSVTVPLLSERIRYPDEAVSTVGLPLICTRPLEALTIGTVPTTLTAVLGFVTVTAVLGFVIVALTPPLLVTLA